MEKHKRKGASMKFLRRTGKDVKTTDELKALFADDAKIKHRESKSSKYISFTASQMMDNPDDIIAIYKQAEKIEKIIAI